MEWQRPKRYYQASVSGRYSVSKAYVHGTPVYTAWRLASPLAVSLGCADTPEIAQRLCENHAAQQETEARSSAA